MDKKPSSFPPSSGDRKQPEESAFSSFKETFINAIDKFAKTAAEIIEIKEEDLKVDLPPPEDTVDKAKGWADEKLEKTRTVIASAISELDEKKEDEAAASKEIMDFDLAGW